MLVSAAVVASSLAAAPQSVAKPGKPPPAPACGGTALAKSSGGYWQCTFDDEFSSSSLDTSKWVVQQTSNSSFHSGPECFVNSPNNVSVADGMLSLTARKEAAPFVCVDPSGDYMTQYTSGMVSTYGKFSQTYGRFEVRAKLPAATVAGLQESFWLWPVSPARYGAWPASGEIDFAEIYSRYSDRAIPYVHYNAASYDANVTNSYCMINDIAQFHTYAVEWTTSTITITYDGTTCLVDHWDPAAPLVKPQPFDQPFLLALTQALGIGANAFDPTTTPLPATTQIDYVRIWK
jgi:beta-glucanase (GH16 family)